MLHAALALLPAALVLAQCASTPAYVERDCPVYEDLGTIRVNPAGALSRHLRVSASFRVCPPTEGLAEITRKRIELKHQTVSLLSSLTLAELEHPLRAEQLRKRLMTMVNERIMKKGQVIDVMITELELE